MPAIKTGLPGRYKIKPTANSLAQLECVFQRALEIKRARLDNLAQEVSKQLFNAYKAIYISIAGSSAYQSQKEVLGKNFVVDSILAQLKKAKKHLSDLAKKYLLLKESLLETQALLNL